MAGSPGKSQHGLNPADAGILQQPAAIEIAARPMLFQHFQGDVQADFGLTVIGIFIGNLATRINTPLIERSAAPVVGLHSLLGKVWLRSFAGCFIGRSLLFPGTNILGYFFDRRDPSLMAILLFFALGSLWLTVGGGLTHDHLRPAPSA